jgi:ribosome-associated translation inhibitor RaiA
MQAPLQISFIGMEPSAALEARARQKTEKLEHLFDRIVSCQVVIEAPHRHRHQGKCYAVRIRLRVPGREIDVSRSGPQDQAHEDPYVALRDAFDAAARQLEDHARKARGEVKRHNSAR